MYKHNIPELQDKSVQKIMDLLNHEFNDLKGFIDDRISIRKDCDDKIKQALSGEESNKEDNLNKAEINILMNGLLESEESEADKKIKHNVIVKYLQEKIVVDLFMRCVEKAKQGTNDDFINLFIENCGFLQEVEFDLAEIHGNEEIPEKIEISKGTISKIADFVNKCWSNMKDNYDKDYYLKEIEMFLHQMFFKKMCGRNLTDIAIKTDIKRKDELKEYFKLENENPDINNINNMLNNDESDIKTNISGDNDKDYKDYLYQMPEDADVVNELYELEKIDLLRKQHEKEVEQQKNQIYQEIRELKKNKLAKLAKLEKNVDVKKINAMLCALISNPNFIQTIANNTNELISNAKNMSPEDMNVFMEILNFVDLPLKNDGNSKGILDIAGWFNPRMYNNLKDLHGQLLKSRRLDFQMYCARHLDKIIDYEIGFEERAKLRKKIAVVLLIAAAILYLSVQFDLITSISLPFVVGISVTTGVIGLGLLAYNYFKSKIIKKAMQLFGCPEWYRLEYDNGINSFAIKNVELPLGCSAEETQMYKLVNSIFSLRRKMHLAERTKVTKADLNQQSTFLNIAYHRDFNAVRRERERIVENVKG